MSKHNAKVGDILRIALADGTHCFAVGDLVKVIEEEDHCELIRTERTSDGTRQWLSAGDYVNITPKPFRPLSPKTSTKRALKAVRDSIVALGWGRLNVGEKDRPQCLLGHIAYVTRGTAGTEMSDEAYDFGKNSLQDRLKVTLAEEIYGSIPDSVNHCLFGFNDNLSFGTDDEYRASENEKHVLKLLDETIAKY